MNIELDVFASIALFRSIIDNGYFIEAQMVRNRNRYPIPNLKKKPITDIEIKIFFLSNRLLTPSCMLSDQHLLDDLNRFISRISSYGVHSCQDFCGLESLKLF